MTDPAHASAGGTTTPQAMALYVYGMIPAADAADWLGADGVHGLAAQVRVIQEGGLAALVGDIPGDRVPGRREDLESPRRALAELDAERATGEISDEDAEALEAQLIEQLLSGHGLSGEA